MSGQNGGSLGGSAEGLTPKLRRGRGSESTVSLIVMEQEVLHSPVRQHEPGAKGQRHMEKREKTIRLDEGSQPKFILKDEENNVLAFDSM